MAAAALGDGPRQLSRNESVHGTTQHAQAGLLYTRGAPGPSVESFSLFVPGAMEPITTSWPGCRARAAHGRHASNWHHRPQHFESRHRLPAPAECCRRCAYLGDVEIARLHICQHLDGVDICTAAKTTRLTRVADVHCASLSTGFFLQSPGAGSTARAVNKLNCVRLTRRSIRALAMGGFSHQDAFGNGFRSARVRQGA